MLQAGQPALAALQVPLTLSTQVGAEGALYTAPAPVWPGGHATQDVWSTEGF
jgi:hypothetical protein